jgi:GT2 family glycosyltransferase
MPLEIPLLSIVIPAYNVAPYVKSAVASALDQTMSRIEVIVVNDGSTDTTRAVLRDLEEQRRDSRLVVVDQQNGGLSVARNTGMKHCSGRYIGFLDADDLWHPQKAEKHIARMDADPDIGMTFSYSSYVDEDDHPLDGMLVPRKAVPSLFDMIHRNQFGNGSSPVVRRECFTTAGVFNEGLRSCEDWEMWCRILHNTHFRAVLVPEPLTIYRLRHTSLTYSLKDFRRNADAAVASLRAMMPDVPPRVLREGHAELYRFIAWRAATSRRRVEALRYFAIALRHCPWLFYHDWRVVATLGAIVLPEKLRMGIQRSIHAHRQRTRRARSCHSNKWQNPSTT